MAFNADGTRPAHEVIFSPKKIFFYPNLYFNNVPIVKVTSQKHLGLNQTARLTVNSNISKAMKCVGLLRKFQYFLPCWSLLTIYKSFIKPHLDYGYAIFDQTSSATCFIKIESVQYNAALAIAETIRSLSREKPFQEVGLEYLHLITLFMLTLQSSLS